MDKSVDKGRLVTFNCTYPLDPTMVEIFWLGPIDIELMSMETEVMNGTETTSTLTFTATNSSFAGNFSCSAYVGGNAIKTSTGALLIINCKLVVPLVSIPCHSSTYMHTQRCHS